MTTGLFDDLVETKEAPATEAPAAEATPETPEKATEGASEEASRETVTVASLNELPDGYVDVKAFAWELTKRNLATAQSEGRVPGPEDMVDTQAVYAATRGKRWSLPSLEAVTEDGTKLGVVIPLEAGLAAWDERPERGVGTGGAGMTPERRATRILRAGKARAALKAWQKREKRYGELLAEVGATWEDAEKAYDEWAESEEAKKEIADNAEKENGND